MPAQKWRHQPSLIRHLIDRPQQFQFFQAVRVIDLWLRRGATVRGPTLERFLRFRNSVSMRFPPCQIEALTTDAEVPVDTDSTLQAALDRQRLRHIRITPAFMGFLGVSGVLPYYYTESIAAQIHVDKNEGGRAFFDSFLNRSLILFYRAWEKCHIEYRLDGHGEDGFLTLQLALAGRRPCLPRSLEEGNPIPHEVAAHYAALIRHRPTSGDMIVGVLNEYFGLPFRLEQFVGAWETLAPAEQSHLGKNKLGVDAMLGQRYWRRDLVVRLWIGPLTRAQFDEFLPSGSGSKALEAMLALFAVPNIRFEAHLILQAKDIKPAVFDGGSKLGRGCFLMNKPATADKDTARYFMTF